MYFEVDRWIWCYWNSQGCILGLVDSHLFWVKYMTVIMRNIVESALEDGVP